MFFSVSADLHLSNLQVICQKQHFLVTLYLSIHRTVLPQGICSLRRAHAGARYDSIKAIYHTTPFKKSGRTYDKTVPHAGCRVDFWKNASLFNLDHGQHDPMWGHVEVVIVENFTLHIIQAYFFRSLAHHTTPKKMMLAYSLSSARK